jgi:hypothetical protein
MGTQDKASNPGQGVESLRTALAELGRDVPSWHLDQVLWRRGAGARYKAEPRHRARSVFY